MSRVQGVYIPQIDGKDLWLSNYSGVGDSYSCKDKNGNINIKRYKAVFDYSLDLIKLREVYYKAYRNNKFSYIEQSCGNIKEYCNKIINVTFEYSVKEFNRTGDNVYLKIGNKLEDIQWEDCIGYNKRHEFIAVKVNVPVLNPVNDLDKAFKLEKNKKEEWCYQAKTNIKCVTNVDNIRKKLYKDGFNIDGIHYIRWKRSSGSARVGKCLFIDEKLYSRMHIWEMCGLEIYTGDKVDLAAIQSYISLTSSSIIGTINLKPENILVVDDYESVFNDDCINVTEENGFLQAKHENVQICNSIWDGQSIIDPSAMGEYSDKGMILLRNRLFKSCAFNGSVQKWFNDNGITDISQLNGKTRAKSISDIKLITTPSSIKYLKFGTLDKWLDNSESTFGVVKYEKPTHFMDGKLVQTHYQLLNSIQLSKEEMQEFLQPTFDFMTLLKTDPAVMRYWIKYQVEDEIEMTPVKSKTDVIYKMMSVNNDFYKTKLYYDFKTDYIKSFSKSLKCGHVLVNGNYSVLCGNPIEMLKQSIGKFDGNAVAEKECIYSTRFDWDKDILGSRSPHITASNVLLTKNKYNEDIHTYMNSTDGIVYVNSINENILQRLAGSDFDSDSLLLTDNSILIETAKRNTDMFKVAVCNVSGTKKQRKWTHEDIADLDIKTSKNLIGDIINCSQELNTLIWHKLANGSTYEDISDIYYDTCKLSILSGIEIDRAKKEFVIDSWKELNLIRCKYKQVNDDDKTIKPNFFAHISKQKGFYNPENKEYRKFKTSMDYLQECVNKYSLCRVDKVGKNRFLSFSEIVNKSGFYYANVYDKTIYEILTEVDKRNEYMSYIFNDNSLTSEERHNEISDVRQELIESIGQWDINRNTMIALLQTIEKEENKKYYRLLFYCLFGYPNTDFYKVIKDSSDKLENLQMFDDGNISLFGYNFRKI